MNSTEHARQITPDGTLGKRLWVDVSSGHPDREESIPLIRDESGALRLADAIYTHPNMECANAIESCLAEGCCGGTIADPDANGWEFEWLLVAR